MSKTGQPNYSGAQAFQGGGTSRSFGTILPLGFLAFGAGSVGVAVLTALSPPQVAFLGKAAAILDRVGLDKGPLLMFGVLSTAMGFALSRLDKASGSADAASDAADFAQANSSSIELQGEILASVQSELGQIRHEIATARHEANEARQQKSSDGHGEASDPLFRLAASLDQLGAQIDKRIDKARREMVDAISSVASTAEVSAQQREESFKNTGKDIDAVRMDIADLRAQLTRVSGDVTTTKNTVEELSTRQASLAVATVAADTVEAQAVASEPAVERAASPAPAPKAMAQAEAQGQSPSPALPKELSDDAPEAQASREPRAPMPAASAESPKEPQYEGFQHEAPSEEKSPEPSSEATAKPLTLGVNMGSLGFPEPPAPMPKPSEGLHLIDEMDEDTARDRDLTPPLFPDVYDRK